MPLYLNIKNIFCLIHLFPIQLCKILFIKMARCFNFQAFLLYTLISTLLHFLIHNVLNCFFLRAGSFTCSAELERSRIPCLVCLNFKYLWSNYKNKMLQQGKSVLEFSHIYWNFFWMTMTVLGKVSLSGNCAFMIISHLFNVSSFGHVQDGWM